MQAGVELVEGERLRHVVVAAGEHAVEPVGHVVARGQEQDWRPQAGRAQRVAHIAAVGVGQPDIDHEYIRPALACAAHGLAAARH